VRNIVAFDRRNARRTPPKRAGDLSDAMRRGAGIGRAEIADDLDAGFKATRKNGWQHSLERGTVAALRILPTHELAQCERALCQRLEHQKARARLCGESIHHGDACIAPVPGKACCCADENFRHGAMLSTTLYCVKQEALPVALVRIASLPSAPWPHPWNCAA